MKTLPRSFYTRHAVTVAKDLLGKYLVRKLPDGTVLSGMIVEVEAYLQGDPASHAFRGRNARNASVYKVGGHAYVHTQRHHTLIDIVAEKRDKPGSVLLRGIVPDEGIEHMHTLRKVASERLIANGPGKLCQAFAISKTLDGIDLLNSHTGLWIEDRGINVPEKRILRTPRIGLGKGKELLLRFVYIANSVD